MSADSGAVQKNRYEFNSVHYKLMHIKLQNNYTFGGFGEKLLARVSYIEVLRRARNRCRNKWRCAHFTKPQKARLIGKLWQPRASYHTRALTRECEEACGAAHIAHERQD